jgi:hypothetical protein
MDLHCIYQGKRVILGLDTETAELLLINAEGEVFFTSEVDDADKWEIDTEELRIYFSKWYVTNDDAILSAKGFILAAEKFLSLAKKVAAQNSSRVRGQSGQAKSFTSTQIGIDGIGKSNKVIKYGSMIHSVNIFVLVVALVLIAVRLAINIDGLSGGEYDNGALIGGEVVNAIISAIWPILVYVILEFIAQLGVVIAMRGLLEFEKAAERDS